MLIPWRVYNSTYCILCVLVVIVFFGGGNFVVCWVGGWERPDGGCQSATGFFVVFFFGISQKRLHFFEDFC